MRLAFGVDPFTRKVPRKLERKKRFERPRHRGVIEKDISSKSLKKERRYHGTLYWDNSSVLNRCDTGSQTDIIGSEKGQRWCIKDEDGSGQEEFQDAEDDVLPSISLTEDILNKISLIKIRLALTDVLTAQVLANAEEKKIFEINRIDLETKGIEITFHSTVNGKLNANVIPLKPDNSRVEETVCTEVDETLKSCVSSSYNPFGSNTINDEKLDLQNPKVTISPSSYSTGDELQEFETAELVDDLSKQMNNKLDPPERKSVSTSTVSSLPEDTVCTLRKIIPFSNEKLYSPEINKLRRSKSDSMLEKIEIRYKKGFCDINEPDNLKRTFNELEESILENSQIFSQLNVNSDNLKNKMTIRPKTTTTTLPSRYDNSGFGLVERSMTCASDAVKSMHLALKPINDQINDIRNKMICMNIQPLQIRSSDGSSLLDPTPCRPINSYSSRRLYLSAPEEFFNCSNALESTCSELYPYETPTVKDREIVAPEDFSHAYQSSSITHFGSRVPSTFALDSCMSFNGKSMWTDPEDIFGNCSP